MLCWTQAPLASNRSKHALSHLETSGGQLEAPAAVHSAHATCQHSLGGAEQDGLRKPKRGSRLADLQESGSQQGDQARIKNIYEWASTLATENQSGDNWLKDYYWTENVERVVSKIKLARRPLIGVLGVQGAGKSAAMRAIEHRLSNEQDFYASIVAVKVRESGALMDTLKDTIADAYHAEINRRIEGVIVGMKLHGEFEEPLIPTFSALRDMLPKRDLREIEQEALLPAISKHRVILIDMPDYPKPDKRLIARDIDDLQGLWNRLMASTSDLGFVVFMQRETFNHADHFFYGKMDIVHLKPLTVDQLLQAYARKWGGYEPFMEEALRHIARISRGIFRRFKRYIALAVEASMMREPASQIDRALVNEVVTEEEIMLDMNKEFSSIFRSGDQCYAASRLIRILTEAESGIRHQLGPAVLWKPQREGPVAYTQTEAAGLSNMGEMAFSRLVRELEERGYVKRTKRARPDGGGVENVVQLNW